MSISDWSDIASNNTSIDGINIAEGCAPGNMNNMGRAIMAAVRAAIGDAIMPVLAASSLANARAAMQVLNNFGSAAVLDGLTPQANKIPYFTGANTSSITDFTSFARQLVGAPDGATLANITGSLRVVDISLAANGYLQLQLGGAGTILVNWGTFASGSNGWSGAYNFPKAFSSTCFGGVATFNAINTAAADGTSVGFRAISASQFQIGSEDVPRDAFMIALGV